MIDPSASLKALLARCDAGDISLEVTLMEMLIASEDDLAVAGFLGATAAGSPGAVRIAKLMGANAAGCARIVAMLRSGVDSPREAASVEDGIAFCTRLFDWSVQQSEECSVALYSLGNPEVLEAATREIVDVLDSWGVLRPERNALDLGCGIGRMETVLALRLAEVQAIDVSTRMIEVARRRCHGLSNVTFAHCEGRDLGLFPDDHFDLVLAVDSFPYLVQSGAALVERHVAEARRVLRPKGELIILNYSYRDDPAADEADVRAMAGAHGLDVVLAGARPFALWNGSAFRLRRPG